MSAFQGPCWAPPGKSTLRLVSHRKAFPLSSVSKWLPMSWQRAVASVLGDQQFDLGTIPPCSPDHAKNGRPGVATPVYYPTALLCDLG